MNVHTQPDDRGHGIAPGQLSTGSRRGDAGRLIGRGRECGTLDRLIEAVRAGESRSLVVRGEPGAGKTVLLTYLARRAGGFRVARAVGVQSEMELAFAGLHQLCAPMLDYIGGLPAPQRDALQTAFGIAARPPPDRFLVGLGVLSLLSEVAGGSPVICLVDDAQWLDRASAQALGFTARRLGADGVGLVFAAREPGEELVGLAELEVGGLRDDDARALLDSALPGPLDARVRDLIVAETRGNPLALLELPRGLSPAQLAGGFGLPGARPSAAPLTGRIEESFLRQLGALPVDTRRLLQLAAADPSGDRSLVWRAAGRLGIGVQAAAPAVEAGLAEFGAGVRFRHPLVRSAAYRSAPIPDRQQMHAALAEVTDPAADPDRRAWHRAQAAAGPDEEVAADLEQSAGRAQARGGLAAAAAFLERAVLLTVDPARQVERALAAAQASLYAGAFGKALEMLSTAETIGSLDEFASARVDLLRGQIAFASSASSDASVLLVRAARRLEPLDIGLARQTYLEAWAAAYHAGRFADAGSLREVARAARSAPPPEGVPRPSDLLLDGLAVLVTEGRAQAAPLLTRTARVFAGDDVAGDEGVRWGWLAAVTANMAWDEERWQAIVAQQLRTCRESGLLTRLVICVNSMAQLWVWRGEFTAAASLIAEAQSITAATGTRFVPYAALMLAGFRGAEAEAAELVETVIADARAAGQGHGIQASHRTSAILYNGLGRYEEARAEAQQAAEEEPELFAAMWALPELIEAASRSGRADLAADALGRLAEATSVGQTDWGQGTYARCRALLADGDDAEGWYREAVDRLGRTSVRTELARTHLLYGEWLRREGRRSDARARLRTAHDMFGAIGMEAFAERTRRELAATGETVRRRDLSPRDRLTPQESQIAQLARSGLSNTEIGAQLFLSTRTIEWHLRKIFAKLGISSRRQLNAALAQSGHDGQPVS
jgi:DNA-binding CsgD family transcriptional regulator/tetratricopeptide (TPR) repeat protein